MPEEATLSNEKIIPSFSLMVISFVLQHHIHWNTIRK